jgi:hypothetical protein
MVVEIVAVLHLDARESALGLQLGIEVPKHVAELLHEVGPAVEGGVVGLVLQERDVVLLRQLGKVSGCKEDLCAVSAVSMGFSGEGHEAFREEGLPLTTILTSERFRVADTKFVLSRESQLNVFASERRWLARLG